MSIRIVFMGSPDFALPSLSALAKTYQVVGVVTQPDRASGRGRELKSPPVKKLALELNIPVMQPEKLREPSAIQQLWDWNPDLIVVAAFGKILRQNVLNFPKFGCINVHASLLPRHRGVTPIQAALLEGDAETGITIIKMDIGIDTGLILHQRAILIGADDTGGSLSEKLSVLGSELLLETIPYYTSGILLPQSQSEIGATYAPMLKKDNGLLDFSHSAAELVRMIRAYYPWPGTFMKWNGVILKINKAHAVNQVAIPGKRIVFESLPAVGTAEGLLVFEDIQLAGKKNIPGKEFLSGVRGWAE